MSETARSVAEAFTVEAVVDPAFAEPQHVAELPPEQVDRLDEQVLSLDESRRGCIWLDAEAAAERIRQQVERAKRADAAARGTSRAAPFWRTGDGVSAGTDRHEGEPHTMAEYAVAMLPLRFQEYIERLLLPE